MKIKYIGNFTMTPYSTENEVRKALEHLGHEVILMQENDPSTWREGDPFGCDFLLWTRTGWTPAHLGFTYDEFHNVQRQMLAKAKGASIPTAQIHLDRWWGLAREADIAVEPCFRCDLVCTADGGHDETWERLGINHRWLPPAVSSFECDPGAFDPKYASDVAFVGSWQGYHPETTHRFELIDYLKSRGDCRFWPEPGEPAIRGEELRNLYASVKVIVGDSCLVNQPNGRYCSDRIPETLGRGGFLIHPHVIGVTDGTLYRDESHLITWGRGSFDHLSDRIATYLHNDQARREIAQDGRSHVLNTATYTHRMKTLIEWVGEL